MTTDRHLKAVPAPLPPDEGASTVIDVRLLKTIAQSGVQWALVMRKDSTLEEVQRYAYGNTLVLPAWGREHLFLLAMTKGSYAEQQLDRYRSGMFGAVALDDLTDAGVHAEHFISTVVFR